VAGSIRYRPDRPKPWLARYRGPDGRERSKTFTRKIEADRWLRQELSKVDRGDWVDPSAGSISVEEWSETWFRSLHGLKPKTLAGYESLLRTRVLPRFGDLALRSVTPAMVREWIADMMEEGLSAARVRQARQVLHALFELAIIDGLIGKNPTQRVKSPPVHPRRQRFLTAQEVALLAEAAEKRRAGSGMLIRFLSYSGLRWGEAVALRVRSVSAGGRRIRVQEAATEVGGKLIFGTPKTHESRTVILPRFIANRLASHLDGKPVDALVFTAPKGGPLRSANFRHNVWRPAINETGLPADLIPHDLRDTAASLMISAGATIKAVQRSLGHASAKMTLDTYGSLFEDDLERLADQLDERFRETDTKSPAVGR